MSAELAKQLLFDNYIYDPLFYKIQFTYILLIIYENHFQLLHVYKNIEQNEDNNNICHKYGPEYKHY